MKFHRPSSYTNKTSPHVIKARKIYNVNDIKPSNELSKKKYDEYENINKKRKNNAEFIDENKKLDFSDDINSKFNEINEKLILETIKFLGNINHQVMEQLPD